MVPNRGMLSFSYLHHLLQNEEIRMEVLQHVLDFLLHVLIAHDSFLRIAFEVGQRLHLILRWTAKFSCLLRHQCRR